MTTIEITKITLIHDYYSDDEIELETTLPDGKTYGSTSDVAILKFKVSRRTGEKYCSDNFPNVIPVIVNRPPKAVFYEPL